MTGTDRPRRRWGVNAVLALIAGATRTTLPPAGGGYRARHTEGMPLPGEIGYPPPPPDGTRGGMYLLSEAMHIPSGHDPYGPHFRDEDCVLSVRTGRCVRDHDCPEDGERGTCKLCGSGEMIRTADDCWHPYTVAKACPPEPSGLADRTAWGNAGTALSGPAGSTSYPTRAKRVYADRVG